MVEIKLQIVSKDGMPQICDTPLVKTIGTMWDSHAQKLVFVRAETFRLRNMLVMIKPKNSDWQEHYLGKENELVVTNAFTQQTTFQLVVLFLNDGNYRLGSNTITFSLREAPQDGAIPEAHKNIVESLAQSGIVNGTTSADGTKYTFKNLAGDVVFTLEISSPDASPVASVYTEIQKTASDGRQVLRVHLHGLDAYAKDNLELRLYRCSRARGTRANWVEIADGQWGYSNLEGEPYGAKSGGLYPPIPAWMPNAGFVQGVYPVYAGTGELLPYVDIDIETLVLPLLKPIEVSSWESCWIYGLSRTGQARNTHPLQFHVFRNGDLFARCQNTACIGPSQLEIYNKSIEVAIDGATAKLAGNYKPLYVKVT